MDKLYGLWANLTQGRGAWAEGATGNVICSVRPHELAAGLWNRGEGQPYELEIRVINADGSPGEIFGEEVSENPVEETAPQPTEEEYAAHNYVQSMKAGESLLYSWQWEAFLAGVRWARKHKEEEGSDA